MKKLITTLLLLSVLLVSSQAVNAQETKKACLDTAIIQAAIQVMTNAPMGQYSVQQVLPIIQELQKSLRQEGQFQPAGDIEIQTQTKEEEVQK